MAFILQDEIEIAPNFSDDVSVLGPKTRYETEGGGYEVLEENPGIRQFIWEHLNDVHRVLHRLTHAGATVSAKELFLCLPEVKIVGHLSTYEGHAPHKSTVFKIQTWPPCKSVSEVRGFLGVAGVVKKCIEGFTLKAAPLVNLTKKEVTRWRVGRLTTISSPEQGNETTYHFMRSPKFGGKSNVQNGATGKIDLETLLCDRHGDGRMWRRGLTIDENRMVKTKKKLATIR